MVAGDVSPGIAIISRPTEHTHVMASSFSRVNAPAETVDINAEEDRGTTAKLYGGDQEMRIRQEIILGMGGVNTLKKLGLTPTVYHMNEGHSAFLNLELIKNTIRDKQVSFDIARDIASSKTVFTTHTPVPAGNDIFPIELVEKYFKDFWPRLGLTREEFLKLGMKPAEQGRGHQDLHRLLHRHW